ncbi:MAG: hypothetical protein AB7G93_07145 [Bdellovibrionales bacterium]
MIASRLTVLLFLIHPLLANTAGAEDFCQQRQALADGLLSETVPTSQETWARENLAGVDVVFFGEHHLHGLQSYYEDVMSLFKKLDSRFNCLFIEEDENSALESADPRAKAKYEAALRLGYTPVFVDNYAPDPKWKLSREEVKKLYDTDRPAYTAYMKKLERWLFADVQRRDNHVASKIQVLLRGKNDRERPKCAKGIALYGSLHIYDPSAEGATGSVRSTHQTIPKLLKKKGVSILAYNILEPLTLISGDGLGNPETHNANVSHAMAMAAQCFTEGQRGALHSVGVAKQIHESWGGKFWNGILLVPYRYQSADPALKDPSNE